MFERFFTELGECVMFVGEILAVIWRGGRPRGKVSDQVLKITRHSLSTVALAGFFVGAILTIQFTLQLETFGALGYLGGLSTSATVREVGPLLIAFLLSGKVGAYTSAELGTMRVNEQIDAIRCLGADPIEEIILPRFFGIVISSFTLLTIGLIASIFGGALLGEFFSGINVYEYIRHIPTIVHPISVLNGLVKCFTFAIVIATVCTFKGFTASGGARGVGRAVVGTAVLTMVGLVVTDWLTSFLFDIALELAGAWGFT